MTHAAAGSRAGRGDLGTAEPVRRSAAPVPSVLTRSIALLRAHPILSLAPATAIVLSLAAMCTGVGLLAAPWFVCELLGVQLTASGREVVPRGRPWLVASFVVLVMLLVAAGAGWLAALYWGPDWTEADGADVPMPWPETLRRVALVFGASTLAALFLAPFVHAPLILLDRGGRLGGALVESAMFVHTTGRARHFLVSAGAQILALSPAVLTAMFFARTFERAATQIGMLVALPLMPISIALGLGLVTAAYVEHAPALGDARRAQRLEALPAAHRAALGVMVLGPLLGMLLFGGSALLPAPPVSGPAPGGRVVLDDLRVDGDGEARGFVEGTSLEVRVAGGRTLSIVAGSEPVLEIPAAWDAPLERVRVVQLAWDYAVEASTAHAAWHVRIDRAGVRVDDSARRRLQSQVSDWALAMFVVGFAVVALFGIRAVAPLGVARARAARDPRAHTLDAEARRVAFRRVLALAPFGLAALLGGAFALLRV